uniref:Uncharacterized protein n=1 Tax=Oryza sativa subsp. japonica TaxID=39947 RepID=Q5VN63_ORYSJ|nr:hypothetical protein [Oryza sativa Japonica Group]
MRRLERDSSGGDSKGGAAGAAEQGWVKLEADEEEEERRRRARVLGVATCHSAVRRVAAAPRRRWWWVPDSAPLLPRLRVELSQLRPSRRRCSPVVAGRREKEKKERKRDGELTCGPKGIFDISRDFSLLLNRKSLF